MVVAGHMWGIAQGRETPSSSNLHLKTLRIKSAPPPPVASWSWSRSVVVVIVVVVVVVVVLGSSWVAFWRMDMALDDFEV